MLKDSLARKETTIGSWLTLGSTDIAEMMAFLGFDWLVIDMEHSSTDLAQCTDLVRTIQGRDIEALVRVRENDSAHIKQVMDAGADGVIVPMVNSAEDAMRAVRSVYYPPVGIRGAGLWRAQGYGMTFDEYKDEALPEVSVIVQIEHIDAVENIEEIMAVMGVDGFMVGPYDLSASLGAPGDFESPRFIGAMNHIRRYQGTRSAGYHVVSGNPEEAEALIEQGYSFIALGIDSIYLWGAAKDALEKLS